jgi:hypothetical protein
MIFLKYKQPKAEYVQFQRLVFALVILSAVLFEKVELIYAFLALSAITFISTVNYSPTTLLFRFFSFLLGRPLFLTAPQYAHSYITHRLAEIFEDILRIAGGAFILYLYTIFPLAGWMMASFMGIAMLISSFFGFCLSSLVYIGYQYIMKRFG